MSFRRQRRCRNTGESEPLRFFSIALDELLAMSPAEVDYLDALDPEDRRGWFDLWRSTREEARR